MANPEEFKSKKNTRINRYFSESFKKKKVKEIEQNLTTVLEVSREYSVSTTAVYKWLHKYSLMRKKAIRQVVEAQSDTRKLKLLRERVKELEQLVGRKQIQLEFSEKMIELAETHYSIDIKKKFGLQRCAGSLSTKTATGGK